MAASTSCRWFSTLPICATRQPSARNLQASRCRGKTQELATDDSPAARRSPLPKKKKQIRRRGSICRSSNCLSDIHSGIQLRTFSTPTPCASHLFQPLSFARCTSSRSGLTVDPRRAWPHTGFWDRRRPKRAAIGGICRPPSLAHVAVQLGRNRLRADEAHGPAGLISVAGNRIGG